LNHKQTTTQTTANLHSSNHSVLYDLIDSWPTFLQTKQKLLNFKKLTFAQQLLLCSEGINKTMTIKSEISNFLQKCLTLYFIGP